MKYNKNEVTGKMRDRIILQNVTRVRSLTGFASEIWTDTTTIWAFAESKLPGSNETIIEGKNTAKNICDFTIRYISSITEESRVVFKNKIYQVKNIKISHDRRFISFQGVYYDSYSTVIGLQSCSASLLAQSSLSAALMRVIKYQASLNAFGSVSADIALVQKVASSLNAFGTLTGDINFVQKVQASLLTSANVTGDITIPKLVQASLTGAGTTTANLTVNAPSASLLLDLYPNAAVAYSLRKLRSAYTGSAIRVRRSSDNTEQDIGFTGNELNTTALLAFCGAGNGFVTTWYDQSENARNARQTTSSNQPQIVSSGTLLLQGSKPIIRFSSNVITLTTPSFSLSVNRTYVMTLFNENNTTGSYKVYLGAVAGGASNLVNGIIGVFNASNVVQSHVGSGSNYEAVGITALTNTTYYLLGSYVQGSVQHQHYRNGILNAQNISLTISPTTNSQVNNIIFAAAGIYDLRTNEAIIWDLYQNTNRVAIETNINSYYAIY